MGAVTRISSNELVPGDIVVFYEAEVRDSF